MSKLKDKLSANMRTVKANQPQSTAKPAPAPAKPNPQAGAKQVPAPKPSQPAPQKQKIAGDVPDSGAKLFPDRVWPD